MFLRFSIQATLSSAVVAAAATTKTPETIGDDGQELIHGGDSSVSSTTKRNPFVPDKIARVPNGDAEEPPRLVEEDVHEAHDDEYAGSLRNSVVGQQDSGTTTTSSTTTSNIDFGILENNVAAPNDTSISSQRKLQLVCDSNPLIKKNGFDFNRLVNNCINYPCYDTDEEECNRCPYNVRIGCWNTSAVTDMKYAFDDQEDFGPGPADDITSWDTSNVRDMDNMFANAKAFNQDIGDWNTEKVTSMFSMFYSAIEFNQDIGDWNTGNVKSMWNMFYNANKFQSNLSGWNTSKVVFFINMFRKAYSFNSDLSGWDTANGSSFGSMFRDARSFNSDLSGWNTTKGSSFSFMFYNALQFNGKVKSLDMSGATSTFGMFVNAENFDQPVGSWDVQNVRSLDYMFLNARAFNRKLQDWNVGKVTSMRGTFYNAQAFNRPIDNWNVTNVRSFEYAFGNANSFNQCLSTWATKVPDDVDTTGMLTNTLCEYSFDPQYGIPWCQGPATSCPVPACADTNGYFAIEAVSCQQIAELARKAISELCSLPWGIAESCPTLCPRRGSDRCYCTDYSLEFSKGLTCDEIGNLNLKKREKKCNNNDAVFENCPSVCSCDSDISLST